MPPTRGREGRRRSPAPLRRSAEIRQHDRAHHRDDERARQRTEKIHRAHGDADLLMRDRVLDRHRDGRIGAAGADTDEALYHRHAPIPASTDESPAQPTASAPRTEHHDRHPFVVVHVQHGAAGQNEPGVVIITIGISARPESLADKPCTIS